MPAGHVQLPVAGRWRRRTASGVVVTAMALGVRHVFDPGAEGEAVVVEADDEEPLGAEAVELHFDARGPDDTWVVVRPWLRTSPA